LVFGHELLVTEAASSIEWGAYPMAPFAGRVRRGRFTFEERHYELPINLAPHAIHGTVFDRPWQPETDTSFVADLGPAWPFRGSARQAVQLDDAGLSLRLEVHAEEPMPVSAGWHPWFRRVVDGRRLDLDFRPGFMWRRDPDGVATRERARVPPGPWDDCFGDVTAVPVVRWPGVAAIAVESSCEHWVVFDERDHAVCVEPQTAPPDALNHDAAIIAPGAPLVATMRMAWRAEEER
jgi:aldose 1-epimerase